MKDLNFEVMRDIQLELQAKYQDKWPQLEPQVARDKLLWMMVEAGEIADVIKKQGDDQIINNPEVRTSFIEEVCDTLMYLNDVMICYNITPEELAEVYLKKHQKNMNRW